MKYFRRNSWVYDCIAKFKLILRNNPKPRYMFGNDLKKVYRVQDILS